MKTSRLLGNSGSEFDTAIRDLGQKTADSDAIGRKQPLHTPGRSGADIARPAGPSFFPAINSVGVDRHNGALTLSSCTAPSFSVEMSDLDLRSAHIRWFA